MDLLRVFNGDFNTKEALREFIIDCINQEAVERLYKREDVSHIVDAKELIDIAFDNLEQIYGIKPKENTVTNQSK